MQVVTLAYWLLLLIGAELIAGLVGAVALYLLSRRWLTRLGAFLVAPIGFVAGVGAMLLIEYLI
jgi:hypothetical protein